MRARRSELSSFGASTGRSSRRYGPRTRAPSARDIVGGLRPRDLPDGRHPSYAASIFCRVETFTLWTHGYLQASHNGTERALRGVVLGRKNHYGSRSRRGTEIAALFYSLIETAKLVGIGPQTYLQTATNAALRGATVPLPHELV